MTGLLQIIRGCAGVALIVLLCLAIFGGWPFWPSLITIGAILVLTLLERFRYKPVVDRAPAGWQATGERFVDPETGKSVQVFYDPATGKRQYVSE